MIKQYGGSRKIVGVFINESDETLTLGEQYNYHGKFLKPMEGTNLNPGEAAIWVACKQDYTLYGTEIYTTFRT
jgi:hypothetical protein